MKNNHLFFILFGIVLVAMTVATGNYVYAAISDFFFLGAGLYYRKQRRHETAFKKEGK